MFCFKQDLNDFYEIVSCFVYMQSNAILWLGKNCFVYACLKMSAAAHSQDKERWSAHKGRKFCSCMEKGSEKGSETGKHQRLTQSEEKVNLPLQGLQRIVWLKHVYELLFYPVQVIVSNIVCTGGKKFLFLRYSVNLFQPVTTKIYINSFNLPVKVLEKKPVKAFFQFQILDNLIFAYNF